MYPLLSKLYLVVVMLALLDFILLFAFSIYIGGDAVNGKIENGKYYVWGYKYQDGVKGFHEVSRTIFDYSKWQVYSVGATWTVMLLGTVLYKRLPTGD